MQRRRFLVGTAAALLLGPSAWGATKKRATTQGLALGFGTYGMKSLTTEQSLTTLSEIGFDAVELACFPGWDADTASLSSARRKSLRQQLSNTGLELTALMDHIGIDADKTKRAARLERIKLAAQLAHDLAPDQPPLLQGVLGGSDSWKEMKPLYAEELGQWIAVAEKIKLNIAIKPHRGSAMSRPSEAVELLTMLGNPARIKMCYDYSHYDLRDMTLEGTIRTALPHTSHVAVKDVVPDSNKTRFMLPGEGGRIDYAKLLRLFYDGGYRDDISCEVSSQVWRAPGYDPVVAAKTSYKNMAAAFVKSAVPRRDK